VNPEEADRLRAEHLNPIKGARRGLRAILGGSSRIIKLQEAKLAEEIKAKRMENDRRQGELRPVGELRSFLNGLIAAARNIWLAIPDQPHLALDQRQRDLLRSEIERGLGEMVRAQRGLAAGG